MSAGRTLIERVHVKIYSLNFNWSVIGPRLFLGNVLTSIFICCRAFAGRSDKNSRAVFAVLEKGLNRVETSVRKREIILGTMPSIDR